MICFLWSVVSADAHICWLTAIWDGVRVDPLNGVGSFASGVVGSAAIAKAAYFSVIRLFSSCCVWDFYEVTLFLQLASGGVEDDIKGRVVFAMAARPTTPNAKDPTPLGGFTLTPSQMAVSQHIYASALTTYHKKQILTAYTELSGRRGLHNIQGRYLHAQCRHSHSKYTLQLRCI